MGEHESEMVENQREELRQLVAELRDRDHELTEMFTAHQQQMSAWQQDWHRAASLEDKCSRLHS